jgi:hypothetical protein
VTPNSNVVLFGEQVKKLALPNKNFNDATMKIAGVSPLVQGSGGDANAIKGDGRSAKKIIRFFSFHLFVPY